MVIWVSSLSRAQEIARLRAPQRIISLLAPEDEFPDFTNYAPSNQHLKLGLDDIDEDLGDGFVAPSEKHIEALVRFVSDWQADHGPLLIHCLAGVSRSSAAAFITACALNPGSDETEIANTLRQASACVSPNQRLIELADDVLSRRGAMINAILDLPPAQFTSENIPFRLPSEFPQSGGFV